jgi:hypothetical protein
MHQPLRLPVTAHIQPRAHDQSCDVVLTVSKRLGAGSSTGFRGNLEFRPACCGVGRFFFFCHLGTLLNAMHDFCRGADFRMRGIGLRRLETGQDGVRFCFKTRDLAEAFQARFGGEMQPEVVRLRKG